MEYTGCLFLLQIIIRSNNFYKNIIFLMVIVSQIWKILENCIVIIVEKKIPNFKFLIFLLKIRFLYIELIVVVYLVT